MPTWYTELKPFHLPNDITILTCKKPVSSIQADESTLLEQKNRLQNPSHSSWIVFHSKSWKYPVCIDTSAIFSILLDDSKSLATISISLMFLSKLLTFWIPDKQKLLTLTSLCTYLRKEFYEINLRYMAKKNLLVMLGALHIEMAMLSYIDDWVQENSWAIALSNSGVISPGNNSLLTGHDVAIRSKPIKSQH